MIPILMEILLSHIFSIMNFVATVGGILEVYGIRFINEVWNSTLSDQNSTEFRSLSSKVSKEVSVIDIVLFSTCTSAACPYSFTIFKLVNLMCAFC